MLLLKKYSTSNIIMETLIEKASLKGIRSFSFVFFRFIMPNHVLIISAMPNNNPLKLKLSVFPTLFCKNT